MEIIQVNEKGVIQLFGDQVKPTRVLTIKLPFPVMGKSDIYVGIDPGTANLGICLYDKWFPEIATLFQISIQRVPDVVSRVALASFIIKYFSRSLDNVTIEGAAYGFSVGAREELAEQRAAFVLELRHHNIKNVQVVAPNSIRKTVFGNGRTKAHEVWALDGEKHMNDALAALSCMYYSSMTM